VLQLRLSSLSNLGSVHLFVLSDLEKVLSNLDPGGSVKLFVLSDLEKVLSDLDPGGSVRIQGVLSESRVFCQECCQNGSRVGSRGFCQK